MRPIGYVAAAVAAISIGVGVWSTGGSTPSTGTGNLWIVQSGGASPCTRQATAQTLASIPSSAKCATPQDAQTAANGGDTVMIEDGTYSGAFSITSGTKTSVVTYQADGWTPPTNAVGVLTDSVKVVYPGGISLGNVDKIHVLGVSAASTPNTSGSQSIYQNVGGVTLCSGRSCTLANQTDKLIQGFHGKSFFAYGGGYTIDLSEFGGFDVCFDAASRSLEDAVHFSWDSSPTSGNSASLSNITFKRSLVHDLVEGPNNTNHACGASALHIDCASAQGGTNVVVDSNYFWNCPTNNIQWNTFTSGLGANGETVQNNYFGPVATPGNLIVYSNNGSCASMVFRYNLIGGIINTDTCTVAPSAYGNIIFGGSTACGGASYNKNAFALSSTTCGTNAVHCNPTWSNPFPLSFSLSNSIPNVTLASSDTCAKGAGDPANLPALDTFGNSRPLGTVDAGPSEIP
jgi:hypothetical protein